MVATKAKNRITGMYESAGFLFTITRELSNQTMRIRAGIAVLH